MNNICLMRLWTLDDHSIVIGDSLWSKKKEITPLQVYHFACISGRLMLICKQIMNLVIFDPANLLYLYNCVAMVNVIINVKSLT